ncbi:MAG TPA: hypothetical protein VFW22_14775 [Pseudolabrys sp.]|nr:hypothetical protein [Pseudolabrys sp.]
MADKRTTPDTPEGAPQAAPEQSRRKKRVAPTIDLTATEVPRAQDSAPQPPRPDPPPAAVEAAPEEAAPADAPPKRLGNAFGMAALGGGAAGVATTLLVLLGLYGGGLLPQQRATSTTAAPQGAADNKVLDALTQRVGALEADIKKLPADDTGLADRLAAAESAMKSLGVALTALNHRSDDIAANAGQARERADAAAKAVTDLRAGVQEAAKNSPAGMTQSELDALQSRIAALEKSAKVARDDIAKASSADVAARLALSAAILRDAVTSGAPFAAELAQAKALEADDKILAPLAPFANSGLPAASALARELNALLPPMIKLANASAPQGGFLERLEANAGKLVRIHPVAAPPGDEPSAVLARLEIDTAKSDIAAALADLGKLDSETRAPARGWIQKAQARQAALAAANRFAADTARALGPKAAAQ